MPTYTIMHKATEVIKRLHDQVLATVSVILDGYRELTAGRHFQQAWGHASSISILLMCRKATGQCITLLDIGYLGDLHMDLGC